MGTCQPVVWSWPRQETNRRRLTRTRPQFGNGLAERLTSFYQEETCVLFVTESHDGRAGRSTAPSRGRGAVSRYDCRDGKLSSSLFSARGGLTPSDWVDTCTLLLPCWPDSTKPWVHIRVVLLWVLRLQRVRLQTGEHSSRCFSAVHRTSVVSKGDPIMNRASVCGLTIELARLCDCAEAGQENKETTNFLDIQPCTQLLDPWQSHSLLPRSDARSPERADVRERSI